jgi:hypothetical protein
MYAPQVVAVAGAATVTADLAVVREMPPGTPATVLRIVMRAQEVLIGLWLLVFVVLLLTAWLARGTRPQTAGVTAEQAPPPVPHPEPDAPGARILHLPTGAGAR